MKMNQNHIFKGTDTTMLMGSMSLYESNMITKDSTAYLDKHKCHEWFIQNLLKQTSNVCQDILRKKSDPDGKWWKLKLPQKCVLVAVFGGGNPNMWVFCRCMKRHWQQIKGSSPDWKQVNRNSPWCKTSWREHRYSKQGWSNDPETLLRKKLTICLKRATVHSFYINMRHW